jgi:hypothetical protein
MKTITLNALFLIFIFNLSAYAQENYFQLRNNVTLAVKTETTSIPDKRAGLNSLEDYALSKGNVVIRLLADTTNKIVFGYELELLSSDDSGKFELSIKPLSKIPLDDLKEYKIISIPNYPKNFLVRDGETASIEVLENPQTKVKVVEYIKVTKQDKRFGGYFPERNPTKDFTLNDIHLKFDQFEFLSNDVKFSEGRRAVFGQNVYFSVPNKGRFIISPFPHNGFKFQKIGTVIDNKLFFSFDNVKYEIRSKSPILSDGGNWFVWILHDDKYKTPVSPAFPYLFPTGAGDTVEEFFK